MSAIPEALMGVVRIGGVVFLAMLVVLYGLLALGLHYDDVVSLIKNKVNVKRYLRRYASGAIVYAPRDNIPLTAQTPVVELAVLLSRFFGTTFTPGDFAYIHLVTKDNVTLLTFKCAGQCRLFYGAGSIPVIQKIKIRTDSVIQNPVLLGLSV